MQIQIEMRLHVGSEEGGVTRRDRTRSATQYGAGTDADAGGWAQGPGDVGHQAGEMVVWRGGGGRGGGWSGGLEEKEGEGKEEEEKERETPRIRSTQCVPTY
ncbi:hypothetical protein CMUS01_10143 [Colletotrichum musicola]|uniref:Uncharacterized protein n=1 Tax=Colletotrichum musicola TaxID=2175873 RepID=A0A8H6K4E6_9PEZI|nr:hypothetical protein CMUS01_10143 [Colletotrichum musicola]